MPTAKVSVKPFWNSKSPRSKVGGPGFADAASLAKIRGMDADMESLIAAAWAARERAYAPYSRFQVGAALLTTSGKVFIGCNVENLSFGLTNCAERVAIGAMIAAGEREIAHLVVVAATDQPISPCGACRQVMAEFGDFPITSIAQDGARFETKVSELLPRAKTGILNL